MVVNDPRRRKLQSIFTAAKQNLVAHEGIEKWSSIPETHRPTNYLKEAGKRFKYIYRHGNANQRRVAKRELPRIERKLENIGTYAAHVALKDINEFMETPFVVDRHWSAQRPFLETNFVDNVLNRRSHTGREL